MNDPRAAYVGQMIGTANPARLLVMLYDRLVLDLQRAGEAQRAGDHAAASHQLMHAQEIVLELGSGLRRDVWEGADRLAAIYAFLHGRLVHANVHHDVAVTDSCLELVRPLADAWRQAALTTLATG